MNSRNCLKFYHYFLTDMMDLFNQLVDSFKTTIDEKMIELDEHHKRQRELLIKDYHGHSAIDHHKRTNGKVEKMKNDWMRIKEFRRNTVHPVSPQKQDQFNENDLESGDVYASQLDYDSNKRGATLTPIGDFNVEEASKI